ncbi:hypothetical protein FNV43_RR07351 [Rhamnella rubrinervis]|uniref:DNA-directed DNA polymerase n=1 Tax=Rhamnella rubrinervis TaxID=2594499 RepID=A0A8K0HF41_9ROSA|nr:hypothetical protein FNV43_RR07351 [Rhamnella rubrinervis]
MPLLRCCDCDLIVFAVMRLLIKYAYTTESDYGKFTICYAMKIPTEMFPLQSVIASLLEWMFSAMPFISDDEIASVLWECINTGFLVVRPGDDLSSESEAGNGIETYFSEDYPDIVFKPLKKGAIRCLHNQTSYEEPYAIMKLAVYLGKKLLFRLRDSLTLLTGSLNNLARNLCPQLGSKGSIPHDGASVESEESYSHYISYASITHPNPFPIHIPNRNEDTFIRRGYYGGHADAYKPYGKNLYYYDVELLISLYHEVLSYAGATRSFLSQATCLRRSLVLSMALCHPLEKDKKLRELVPNSEWSPPRISAAQLAAAITACARFICIHTFQEMIVTTRYGLCRFSSPLPEEEVSSTVLGKFKLEYIVKKGIFLAPKSFFILTQEGEKIIKHEGLAKSLVNDEWFESQYADISRTIQTPVESNFKIDWERLNITKKETLVNLGIRIGNKREPVFDNDLWVDTMPLDVTYFAGQENRIRTYEVRHLQELNDKNIEHIAQKDQIISDLELRGLVSVISVSKKYSLEDRKIEQHSSTSTVPGLVQVIEREKVTSRIERLPNSSYCSHRDSIRQLVLSPIKLALMQDNLIENPTNPYGTIFENEGGGISKLSKLI